VYSFSEHQRLDETKYLYGPTVIIGTYCLLFFRIDIEYQFHRIAEGIMALLDPALRSLYDLKVSRVAPQRHLYPYFASSLDIRPM